jgi:hypothetical protein
VQFGISSSLDYISEFKARQCRILVEGIKRYRLGHKNETVGIAELVSALPTGVLMKYFMSSRDRTLIYLFDGLDYSFKQLNSQRKAIFEVFN